MEPVLELTKDGDTLRVFRDECPEDPRRNGDYLGTMACWHRRYQLGDEQPFDFPANWLKAHKDDIMLPLFLMDHSGLSISTTDHWFRMADSAGWDWGQVGYIWVSREKVRQEWNVKRISPKLRKLVEDILRAEVREYDAFLRGDVYGYTVEDETGRPVDSCWGFLGDHKESGLLHYVPEKFRQEVLDA